MEAESTETFIFHIGSKPALGYSAGHSPPDQQTALNIYLKLLLLKQFQGLLFAVLTSIFCYLCKFGVTGHI